MPGAMLTTTLHKQLARVGQFLHIPTLSMSRDILIYCLSVYIRHNTPQHDHDLENSGLDDAFTKKLYREYSLRDYSSPIPCSNLKPNIDVATNNSDYFLFSA